MAGNPPPYVGFPAKLAAVAAFLLAAMALVSPPAQARGPDGIADVAEKVINAVVNVSTSQSVDTRGNATPPPLPSYGAERPPSGPSRHADPQAGSGPAHSRDDDPPGDWTQMYGGGRGS